MFKNERKETILELLQHYEHMTPHMLAEKTFTSYSSIRRDLEELENAGLIHRNYGRVELVNNHPTLVSYPVRISKNSEQKLLIAKKAAALIQEGDTIFIDSSSSCSYFAKELLNLRGITVVTNNVEVLYFMTQNNTTVICSGGIQAEPNRYALIGAGAETTFSNIHADWAVFSTRSLTQDGLLYDIHYHETVVRNIMLKNADKKMFLCDSSKLNTISTYHQCSLSDVDYLVCDSPRAREYKKSYPQLTIL